MDIRIPAGVNVGGACAEEDFGRFAMTRVLAYAAEGQAYLAATDGRILALLPVEGEGPAVPTLLPPRACRGRPGGSSVTIRDGEVRRQGDNRALVMPLPAPEGKWPDAAAIMAHPAGDDRIAITLDIRHLVRLTEAISADGRLTLLVRRDKPSESYVSAVGWEDSASLGVGCIMPLAEPKPGSLGVGEARAREAFARLAPRLPGAMTFPLAPSPAEAAAAAPEPSPV